MPEPQLSALLVDDERLARAGLRQLLQAHPEIEVIGEADSIDTALSVVAATRPDVIFLDVQMPGGSGFELLDRLTAPVRIVFVTAYDRYAVRAFDVNALDYLLKPVQPARLAAAVRRLLSSPLPGEPPVRPVSSPGRSADEESPLSADDLLFLEFHGRSRFVRVRSLRCVSAEGPYSRVTTAEGESTLVLRSMRDWERRLPSDLFLRIHRSTIVNATAVAHVRDEPGYRCAVFLEGVDTPLIMSRRHARRLRRQLS